MGSPKAMRCADSISDGETRKEGARHGTTRRNGCSVDARIPVCDRFRRMDPRMTPLSAHLCLTRSGLPDHLPDPPSCCDGSRAIELDGRLDARLAQAGRAGATMCGEAAKGSARLFRRTDASCRSQFSRKAIGSRRSSLVPTAALPLLFAVAVATRCARIA